MLPRYPWIAAALLLAMICPAVHAAPAGSATPAKIPVKAAPQKMFKDVKLGFSFTYDGDYSLISDNPQARFILTPRTQEWTMNMNLQPVTAGQVQDVANAVQMGLLKQVAGIQMLSRPAPYKNGWYTFDCIYKQGEHEVHSDVYVDLVPDQKTAYVFSASADKAKYATSKGQWEKVLGTFKN